MTPRRRLLVGLAVAAAVLLVGRVSALVYSDFSWFRALGASALWRERARDIAVIHLTSAVFAGLFALLNLSALRRSIVSLAFPRRLGNVEFGEAVPQRHLDRVAFLLALLVAGVMAFGVPPWEELAMVRTGTRFGESDPFFQMDLSFYTGWVPLETSVYEWALMLLVVVSSVVIGLYALTPSLRWHSGAFHVSVHVRRHLAVLATLFLLIMAWSYRIDGYHLLMQGSGPDGRFSYVDHQWLIPAYLSLSVGTVAAAAIVFMSGWAGRVRTSFFTVSAVLIFSVALDLILPSVVRRLGASGDPAQEAPYEATRAVFTRRAYGLLAGGSLPAEVKRFDSFADSSRIARITGWAGDSALVYPGAAGAAIVRRGSSVAAPSLGGGLQRLAHAWSEQRLDIAWSAMPGDAKIVRTRDVRDRVAALMPPFAQGGRVIPAYLGDTLIWVLELYSASNTYPLSRHYQIAGDDRAYFRHSGTALLNASTGRLIVVPAPGADPIAVAWRARFPANFRPGVPDLLDELTPAPRGPRPAISGAALATGSDSTFRAEVKRLYSRMRSALSAGDLAAFGAFYDSLGAVAGRE